jgi:hypothetical protein
MCKFIGPYGKSLGDSIIYINLNFGFTNVGPVSITPPKTSGPRV